MASLSTDVIFEAPPAKVLLLAKLRERVSATARLTYTKTWPTAGEMARDLDPHRVQTPALDLVDSAIADVDAGLVERVILSMPPQEGKSEAVSHYGALWLLHQNPARRIAIVSYDGDNAGRLSYAVRNDLVTFTGEEDTIDLSIRLRRDSKAASRWYLEGHRGGVYAIGIGGSLTGRPVDVLIIDDPVKDYRAADSQLQSEQAWQWWMSVARPRLAPGAPVILVQTRWHENDLAGRFLAKQREDERSALEHFDRWTVINIPAQAAHRPELDETDLLGREPGEFMQSARGRTREQWEATKAATTARIWSAMYQGAPSPDEGTMFKRHFWQRYDTPKAGLADDGTMRCPAADEVIQSWDMAFKDRNSSDYVVGQVWARFGNTAWLLDQVRARMSFTETCQALIDLSGKWPQARAKLVEDKANGTAVIDQLKKTISGLIPINPGTDSKYVRALAVSPFIEARQVHVPSDALYSWAAGFVDEHAMFPNSTHDDQVDTMTQAVTRLLGRQHGPVQVATARGLGAATMSRTLPGPRR